MAPEVVKGYVHVEVGWDLPVHFVEKAMKSALVWDLRTSVIIVSVATLRAAKWSQVPLQS